MSEKNPPERGLYVLSFYDAAGDEILVAITADGRCLDWRPFKPHTYDESHEILEYLLDTFDPPQRMLEVVR
jgi:hypothetical protein